MNDYYFKIRKTKKGNYKFETCLFGTILSNKKSYELLADCVFAAIKFIAELEKNVEVIKPNFNTFN